jgi:hypothetical protein
MKFSSCKKAKLSPNLHQQFPVYRKSEDDTAFFKIQETVTEQQMIS